MLYILSLCVVYTHTNAHTVAIHTETTQNKHRVRFVWEAAVKISVGLAIGKRTRMHKARFKVLQSTSLTLFSRFPSLSSALCFARFRSFRQLHAYTSTHVHEFLYSVCPFSRKMLTVYIFLKVAVGSMFDCIVVVDGDAIDAVQCARYNCSPFAYLCVSLCCFILVRLEFLSKLTFVFNL
jgi:hypothetical protein